jgi:hypothetical protein
VFIGVSFRRLFAPRDGSTHEKTASRAVAGAFWTHETRHAYERGIIITKVLIRVLSMQFS